MVFPWEKYEKPITVGRVVIDPQCRAYCMDGGEHGGQSDDIRRCVSLPSCNCCDYFCFDEGAVILIEETDLHKTVKRLRDDFLVKEDSPKPHEDLVKGCVTNENRTKVYGSLLVLCRLAQKYREHKAAQDARPKYKFWLLFGGKDKGDFRAFDHILGDIRENLSNVLSGTVSEAVLISAESLKKKLPKNCCDP